MRFLLAIFVALSALHAENPAAFTARLDQGMWNDVADLFADDAVANYPNGVFIGQRSIRRHLIENIGNGKIGLGDGRVKDYYDVVYVGRDRVRGFLEHVFGRGGPEGPVEGRLGNHLQLQPVIHISPDGQTARIRVRLLQQLSMGGRASLGAGIYENEAVKEDGVWKFKTVHTYNTFTANYIGGWAKNPGQTLPGPSKDYPPDRPPTLVFAMFPKVYSITFDK